MTVKDLYGQMEARIPRALSCSWDNDGLMCCPEPERHVARVLVSLDVTAEVVQTAIAKKYDLIVSHHPLIFRPMRALDPVDPVAKKCIALLRAGIAVMSFHTRLDAVEGGVNDTLASVLGLRNVLPFEGEDGMSLGRIGETAEECSIEDFAHYVKKVTRAETVSFSDAGRTVRRVALVGGSGSDEVRAAARAGADTYLSGELPHHAMTDAPECGMNLVAAGHYATEQPVTARIAALLREIAPELTVDIVESRVTKTV